MKKKIAAIAFIIICLSLISSGTLAYFTVEETTNNVITTGNIKIKLNEYTLDDSGARVPFPKEGMRGKMPGDSIAKIVEVENTGFGSAWVRIKADVSAENSLGSVTGGSVASKDALTFTPGAKWHKKDGFYYYEDELLSGSTTEPFIESVQLNPLMGNEYQGAKLNLSVTAYAVQKANNGNTWQEALGWPE